MDNVIKPIIIILTSLFHPEIAANSKRMTHLALALKARGFDVSVITAHPYYTTAGSSVNPGKWIPEDNYNGLRIIRSYIYRNSKYGSILLRLLSFLSFMISAIIASFKIHGKADAVITISPPFTSLLSGYIISRIKRCSLIIDVQDIYPETLVSLGFLKNQIIIAMLEWIEKFFYRKAAGIAVISDGFKKNITKKAKQSNTAIIPNWADIDLFKPGKASALRTGYNFKNRFIVMFAGTMGFAQGLDHVVKCAALLKDERKIIFAFLGDGVEKEKLITLASEYRLANTIFLPPVPNSAMPDYLSLADVCLVYLRKNNLYTITIPSKLYEYMAMAKPVITGVMGDALRLVQKAGCGIGVEPESPEALSRAVLELNNNRKLCRSMGRSGREYVVSNYSKDKILSKYTDFIDKAILLKSISQNRTSNR